MDGHNDLGRAIRRLRGARTQCKVAEAADIKASTWSEYERGRRLPRGRNLARIAAALGVDVRVLESAALEESRARLGDVKIEIGLPAAASFPGDLATRLQHLVESALAVLVELNKLLSTAREQLPEQTKAVRADLTVRQPRLRLVSPA